MRVQDRHAGPFIVPAMPAHSSCYSFLHSSCMGRSLEREAQRSQLASLMSVLVITSPSPSNPDTFLCDKSLESLFICLPCMSVHVPIIILLDGYVVARKGEQEEWRHTACNAWSCMARALERMCWSVLNLAPPCIHACMHSPNQEGPHLPRHGGPLRAVPAAA